MSFEAKHSHHLEQSPTCLQLDPAAVLFRAGSEKNAASPRPSTKLQPVYAARLRVRFVSVANKACSAAQPGLGIGVTMEAHTRFQLKPHACWPVTVLSQRCFFYLLRFNLPQLRCRSDIRPHGFHLWRYLHNTTQVWPPGVPRTRY